MPYYYMHLHECGSVTTDHEGVVKSGLTEAVSSAVTAARDVMSNEIRAGQLCLSCHIIIEDAEHKEVARVAFRDAVELKGAERR